MNNFRDFPWRVKKPLSLDFPRNTQKADRPPGKSSLEDYLMKEISLAIAEGLHIAGSSESFAGQSLLFFLNIARWYRNMGNINL